MSAVPLDKQDGLRVDALSWCSEQQRGVKVENNTFSLDNRLFTPTDAPEILKMTYGSLYVEGDI